MSFPLHLEQLLTRLKRKPFTVFSAFVPLLVVPFLRIGIMEAPSFQASLD